jgi:hypothetical protein
VPGGRVFPFWIETHIEERRQEMCCGKTKCERPKDLKGKPEECAREQVKKCHGSDKNHPCVTKKKAK